MTRSKFDVLVVGELNLDLILNQIKSFPQLGKEIIADEQSLTLGSSSAIFASNLSVLGDQVAFLGKIGKDQFGDMVIKSLTEKKVDTGYLTYSAFSKTGISIALSYGNERAMVTYPGAMNELTEEDISDESLGSARHLHVSSVFLQPSLKKGINRLFRRAKDLGLTTSLDPQWDPEERWDCQWDKLLPAVDVFMPNMEEIKQITGKDNLEACINTIKGFSNILIIKKGTEGAIAWGKDTIIKQKAFFNPAVIDTIGAGDTFNAGFIHQFLRGKELNVCLEFGALCGAINTTSSGGTTAFESLKSIQQTALNIFKYSVDDL